LVPRTSFCSLSPAVLVFLFVFGGACGDDRSSKSAADGESSNPRDPGETGDAPANDDDPTNGPEPVPDDAPVADDTVPDDGPAVDDDAVSDDEPGVDDDPPPDVDDDNAPANPSPEGETSNEPTPSAAPMVDDDGGVTDMRAEAAAAVANGEPCEANRPFYWELGDRTGPLAGGAVARADGSIPFEADTVIGIASASKWLYSSYVLERKQGELSDDDIRYLTLRSGYSSFLACFARDTVSSCMDRFENGDYDESLDGVFYYGGGHMQAHAIELGLGELDGEGLATEIRSQLGMDIQLEYSLPEPAGGSALSPANYAKFLRMILNGELVMASMLGANAVCASPDTCPTEAANSAAPPNEVWAYSLGHWVETDPDVGDGAFSSLGLFGFYPWIDRTSTWYGIVANRDIGTLADSLNCGRRIRAAWVDAADQ
jgi:hypothetical protein